MTTKFPVVLDACVLIPMPLADTLLRLAAGPRLYLPKWTTASWQKSAAICRRIFGLSREQIVYRETEIRKHFTEAWIEGYEDLIPSMTNSEKDRHVLAAAVRSNSEVVVTYNHKDFPRTSLLPYSITALGPSAFLTTLYNINEKAVIQVLQEQAAAIDKSVDYVLQRLRVNAPHFVEMLSQRPEENQ